MMKFVLPIGLIAMSVNAVRAETPFDAAVAAKMLAPFLDEHTYGVVRLDLTAVDTDEWIDRIAKWTGMTAQELAEQRKDAKNVHARLRQAGVLDFYAILSLDHLSIVKPLVLTPAATPGDAAAIAKLLTELGMEANWTSNGVAAAGPAKAIERLKTQKPSPRPDLVDAFGAIPSAAAQFAFVPSADQRRVFEESLPKLPAQFGGGPGTALSRGIKWAAAGVVTKPKVSVQVVVQSPDDAAAKSLGEVATKALDFVAKAGKENEIDLQPIMPALTPEVAGSRLTVNVREDDEAVTKVLASAATKARAAAGRKASMTNLKQIALALHNYHGFMGAFPATGSMSKDGKPLLSWRVHILPFLEQENLYKQFKLDEPWDSEHNKALIAKMPDVFRSPAQKVGDGKTTYLAPMGQNTVIAPGAKGTRIGPDIRDGVSWTIMTVEVNDDAAVIWTKPDDLDVAAGDVLKKLLGHYDHGFIAGIADGSVRFVRGTIDPKLLQALFTRNGGEVVELDKIP